MQGLEFELTARQAAFIDATADEVLFGGAAGGGKSYGQFMDTVLYAASWPGSKQLILRRSFPELEQSIIRTFTGTLPGELFKYNAARHTGRFQNGSLIDFGYMDREEQVHRYQSAEYDVIRFDELTHFTEYMYIYLLSRLRGSAARPRQMKSSTNPGGIGHAWVKQRFIDPAEPGTVFTAHDREGRALGTRVYLPSRLSDNPFLTVHDPQYRVRLENLSARDRKALLLGDWNLTDGQFFDSFDPGVHVIPPLWTEPPKSWAYYIAIDYGLDMLAALLMGIAPGNKVYVIDEFYDGAQHPEGGHKGLIVSKAAEAILKLKQGFPVQKIFAPPDLWGRSKDTGRSIAEVFGENGVRLTRVDNNRVSGWMALKELMNPYEDEQGALTADLQIFSCCRNLIRTLPSLSVDPRNPNDAATEPHELTHAPDALRYFVAGRPRAARQTRAPVRYDFDFQRPKRELDLGDKIKPI